MVFHSSISKAKIFANNQSAFTELFPNYWNLDAFHVSGKMNTSERDKIIKEDFLNSKRALITNARCLTEGVDVPDIDCVLFADPKKSTIDIVQAVGRALRIKEGKKFGYVIVPVIIETVNPHRCPSTCLANLFPLSDFEIIVFCMDLKFIVSNLELDIGNAPLIRLSF